MRMEECWQKGLQIIFATLHEITEIGNAEGTLLEGNLLWGNF